MLSLKRFWDSKNPPLGRVMEFYLLSTRLLLSSKYMALFQTTLFQNPGVFISPRLAISLGHSTESDVKGLYTSLRFS